MIYLYNNIFIYLYNNIYINIYIYIYNKNNIYLYNNIYAIFKYVSYKGSIKDGIKFSLYTLFTF